MTVKQFFFEHKFISIFLLAHVLLMCLLLFFFIEIGINNWADSHCTKLEYNCNTELSNNGDYIGIIQDSQVIIMNRNGERVSEFHSNLGPAEIALGERSYFLLYRNDTFDGDIFDGESKIVQLDYQSNVLEERVMDDYISTIACRNGILFMAKWLLDDYEDETEINRFHDGFSVNFYVKEDGLRGEVCELHQDQENIEGIDLFYHSAGFFATEPELEDYPGMHIADFGFMEEDDKADWETEDDEGNGQEEGYVFGQRAKKNKELLSNQLEDQNNNSGWRYGLLEYQTGNKIYGVCNVVKGFNLGGSVPIHKIVKSYSYGIDCSNDQIRILGELPSVLALYTTGTYVIYQNKNQLIKRNYASGKEDVIYTINSMRYFHVKLQGKYLLLEDNDECIPIEI